MYFSLKISAIPYTCGHELLDAVRVLPRQFVCLLNISSYSDYTMGGINNGHSDVADASFSVTMYLALLRVEDDQGVHHSPVPKRDADLLPYIHRRRDTLPPWEHDKPTWAEDNTMWQPVFKA
jgi:hypothetical protein